MSEPILSDKTKLSIRAMMCIFRECKRYWGSTYFLGDKEITFADAYRHLDELLKDMEGEESE